MDMGVRSILDDPDPPFETHIPLMSGEHSNSRRFFMSVTGCPAPL